MPTISMMRWAVLGRDDPDHLALTYHPYVNEGEARMVAERSGQNPHTRRDAPYRIVAVCITAEVGERSPTLDPEALGRERAAAHAGQASSRPLSENYETIGIAGELALSAFLGTAFDDSVRPEGDGGVDAIVNGTTINVYTARRPIHLIVERGKPIADICVLAKYDPATKAASLIGWAFGVELAAQEPRDVGGMGVLSHAIHFSKLHSMPMLMNAITTREGQDV